MGSQWIIATRPPELSATARSWGIPDIIAQLLFNRGLVAGQSPAAFLAPKLSDLHDPNLLPGAVEAARLIAKAVEDKRKIVLYGDYDVDGTTGVAILWHLLHQAGGRVDFYVPHRVEEGYGLNKEAAQHLIDGGVDLVVTVDCGITAVDVARQLTEAGIKLIITDHHTPQDVIPSADVIVHPTLTGGYPNPHLCGAGVAFKLAWAVARQFSGSDRVSPEARVLLAEMLALAALGTIADVVPLTGENRIIAKHGLERLATTSLPGLRSLIDLAGLSGDKINSYDVGFKLAPRINAAGRMGHARLAVELLTRADGDRAREIALYLEEHNRSRKAAERKIFQQAREMIESNNLACDARRAIVLASEGWHAGVIGIVASRVVDRYRRPTIMISLENGQGQGSARSIEHFDVSAALALCQEDLLGHGGHFMAAGLRIATERVDHFTEAFVRIANNLLTGKDLIRKLRLDDEVGLDELTMPTVEAIAGLGPFGSGNPKPAFATDWVELADEPRRVGAGGKHLTASFRQNGACIRAIGFGMGDTIEDLKQHRRCRLAFEPIVNEFNGRRTVEMRIVDTQFPR